MHLHLSCSAEATLTTTPKGGALLESVFFIGVIWDIGFGILVISDIGLGIWLIWDTCFGIGRYLEYRGWDLGYI